MSAQRQRATARRPLPPHGREIVEMLRRRERPAAFGGSVFVALDWSLARSWARIVLPAGDDPQSFDLSFLRGLDLIVVYRPGHQASHLQAALEAVQAAAPHVCAVMQIPHLAQEA